MKNLKKSITHLNQDPILAAQIVRFGVINYRPPKNRFDSLVSSIISQQLSNKAADTIYSRFLKLFPTGKYTPQAILDLNLDLIKSCGTSRAKAQSLHDLSQKILDGTVRLDELSTMNDEQVIAHLTQVKGIGRWTAEMKLMFTLHRPDILPLDDVGIQNAFVKLYGLNRRHKSFPSKMLKIAKNWQPYRTLACWYLWKSLDNE